MAVTITPTGKLRFTTSQFCSVKEWNAAVSTGKVTSMRDQVNRLQEEYDNSYDYCKDVGLLRLLKKKQKRIEKGYL